MVFSCIVNFIKSPCEVNIYQIIILYSSVNEKIFTYQKYHIYVENKYSIHATKLGLLHYLLHI